jgi:cell division protein FtsN
MPHTPDAAPAGRQPAGRYEIVVAAFRTPTRAADVASGLAAQGLPAVVRATPAANWHHVIVGPYTTMEDVGAAQQMLLREGFSEMRVLPVVSKP